MKHDKNDLLRRQDCIEAIEGITCSMSLCVNADECHGMQRMRKQAVIELANMPAAQPEQRWIPFRERSPKEGQQILACSEDGVMWMTAYNSQSRFSGAWMPLPEPYRGGKE